LWGEPDTVRMALFDTESAQIRVVALLCPGAAYPSIGRSHPPAIRLERAVADLYGLVAMEAPDPRPWLDHGRWGMRQPLGDARDDSSSGDAYPFLPVEGESLHQISVGPVHAGIIEPGHFRFTASGETVVRLEERLGYTHRGVEKLLCRKTIDEAARIAG